MVRLTFQIHSKFSERGEGGFNGYTSPLLRTKLSWQNTPVEKSLTSCRRLIGALRSWQTGINARLLQLRWIPERVRRRPRQLRLTRRLAPAEMTRGCNTGRTPTQPHTTPLRERDTGSFRVSPNHRHGSWARDTPRDVIHADIQAIVEGFPPDVKPYVSRFHCPSVGL